uniref:Uncharacterized protein n=1 Tax=Oryza glumipatula TaxID=40148 RepID=A0A0D9ZPP7_9ORYZ
MGGRTATVRWFARRLQSDHLVQRWWHWGVHGSSYAPRPGVKGVMAVLTELAAVGHLPRCRSAPSLFSLFLEFLPFSLGSSYVGLRRQLVSEGSSEPQTTDATPSSSRLSFGQNWQGGQRMAGWRRPGPVPRGFSDLDSFC